MLRMCANVAGLNRHKARRIELEIGLMVGRFFP
jgi:hypothetical protein